MNTSKKIKYKNIFKLAVILISALGVVILLTNSGYRYTETKEAVLVKFAVEDADEFTEALSKVDIAGYTASLNRTEFIAELQNISVEEVATKIDQAEDLENKEEIQVTKVYSEDAQRLAPIALAVTIIVLGAIINILYRELKTKATKEQFLSILSKADLLIVPAILTTTLYFLAVAFASNLYKVRSIEFLFPLVTAFILSTIYIYVEAIEEVNTEKLLKLHTNFLKALMFPALTLIIFVTFGLGAAFVIPALLLVYSIALPYVIYTSLAPYLKFRAKLNKLIRKVLGFKIRKPGKFKLNLPKAKPVISKVTTVAKKTKPKKRKEKKKKKNKRR